MAKEDKEKIRTTSTDINEDNLLKLKYAFPQFVRDNAVDYKALEAFLKNDTISNIEDKYGLGWAGRSKSFQLIRTPSTGTLEPLENESIDWENTENIFIEGDNLEVLKLLQKQYKEKVKMIYIDPPYNTGKDFIYTDNFIENKSDYYERTGQSKNGIKLTTNSESAGRYHSDWLTMMYPRLFLARNLLKNDGVIFVSIDDNEVANLRLIMDEIFGEENFVGQLVHQRAKGGGQAKYIVKGHDYILVYAKILDDKFTLKREKVVQQEIIEKDGIKFIKDNDIVRKKFGKKDKDAGDRRCFYEELEEYKGLKFKEDVDAKIATGEYFLEKAPNGLHFICKLTPLDEASSKLYSIIKVLSEEGKKDLEDLGISIFDYPKPVELIRQLVEAGTFDSSKKEIILDFFAGSGTTAQAVMQLNTESNEAGKRKYICVQVPQELDESDGKTTEAKKAISEAISLLKSLKKPTNIAEISKERIRRASKKIGQGDNGFKSFRLSKSCYSEWNTITDKDNTEILERQLKLFLDQPLVKGYEEKSVIYEILLKEGFDLNSKVIHKSDALNSWSINDKDKKMVVTFAESINKDQIAELKLEEDETLVCFDNALDDTLKVNIAMSYKLKVL